MRAGLLALAGAAAALPARGAAPVPAPVTANFSGGDAVETASARAHGKTVRLEIANAAGKTLAKTDVPSPNERDPEIALAAGSIGSVGSLLEVAVSSGATVCRSVWRFRDGRLTRLPVLDVGKPLPDCEPAGTWRTRWDESENSPAHYVRERTRDLPPGHLVETRVFDFQGFELSPDAKRTGATINGAAIPDWYRAELYPKVRLDAIFDRFGLAALRKSPRLRFEADRENGIFVVVLSDAQGSLRLPVTSSKAVESPDPGVELSAGDPPARVVVTLARGSIPQDAVVHGTGARFDGAYAPVIHWNEKQIRVYPDAEQELASEGLPGPWATEKNETVLISAAPVPGAIRFGDAEFSLKIDGAPEGTDILLVPNAGGQAFALVLRGANAFQRVPIVCADGVSPGAGCRIAGDPVGFKRLGSQLNAR